MQELETPVYKKHSCVEVAPGLVLGSVHALRSLKVLGVTHVLTLCNAPMRTVVEQAHLHVYLPDRSEANLLGVLDTCIEFIEIALATPNNRILVHCFAGMSRSAAVVVAYLMKKQKKKFEETFNALTKTYPSASPNEGFIEQLEHYGELFYDAKIALVAHREGNKEFEDSMPRILRNELAEALKTINGVESSPEAKFRFRCRNCLLELGDESNLLKVETVNSLQSTGCLFLEKCNWMEKSVKEREISGKLYCPQCNEKLGSFNWSGIRDGHVWHVPGFLIHLSKLDVLTKEITDEISIRRPRLGDLANSEELKFEYVVFDCDGVLVNTEVASCESLYLCIRDVTGFEIPRKFPQDYYEVFGMDVLNCLKHFKRKYQQEWDCEGIVEEVCRVKEHHYQELTAQGISAFDGVIKLLKALQKRRDFIGVASSGQPIKLKRNLRMPGLIDFFKSGLVVSASEVARGKPSPDVYLEAFRRLKVSDPSQVLVIEDSTNGLKAARAAGAFAVGITNSLPRDLLQPHSDLVVDNISEIEKFLYL